MKVINSVSFPFSESCERNKAPINEVLSKHLVDLNSLLEIGSGTGQHADFFTQNYSLLNWQMTDCLPYLESLSLRQNLAQRTNLLSPRLLDVNQPEWDLPQPSYPAIFTANTLHIMSLETVVHFFEHLEQVLSGSSTLFIYGPFKYSGKYTSESNAAFDLSLRSRGEGSCIKDIEDIIRLAGSQQLKLTDDISMPANNQMLIFKQGVG